VYEGISPQCTGITDCRSETIRGAVNAATTTIQNACVIIVVHTFVFRIVVLHSFSFIDSKSGFPYIQAVTEICGFLEGGLADYDALTRQFL
jgi:hypothetical protein